MANKATHSLSAHAVLGLQQGAEWVLAASTHVDMIAGVQNLPSWYEYQLHALTSSPTLKHDWVSGGHFVDRVPHPSP